MPSPAIIGQTADSDHCVVLVSLDGFAHFYIDDPLTHMPTMRRMIREGAVADGGLECSFPTVTWPNHTTLVTGVTPAKHGVLSNMVFSREKGETIQLLVDPVYDKEEIVKVPTVYDAAHAAGLKTAAVVWPATRNAKTLHWTTPDMKSPHFEKFATPGWLDELKAEGIPVDRYGPWVEAKEGGPRRDWIATREVISLLKRKAGRPNLILLHLIELDHAQHETGPRSGDARWAVATMDDRIRDLRDAIEELGLRDKVTLLVTSDHGFFATDRSIHVNSKLRDLGLVKVEEKKVTSKRAWSISQGGAASVYVVPREERRQITETIVRALDDVEGIEAIFEPKDFAKIGQATPDENQFGADLWLAAKEGYTFSNDATRENIVTQNPKRDGAHGYLPHHPDLLGILIAWGRGVRPGSKLGHVHNTHVAPTIARLLNVDFRTADGKPLVGIGEQSAK